MIHEIDKFIFLYKIGNSCSLKIIVQIGYNFRG